MRSFTSLPSLRSLRSSTSPFKTIAARAMLALVFLCAQQTASLHWLSHAVDATRAKAAHTTAPSEHCDECVALSALGAGLATHVDVPLALAGHHTLLASEDPASAPAPLRLAFRSRAPPTLS